MKNTDYDLVIIGAGCMGMAMAYTARKHGKKCLLLEKQKIGDANRYFSSSFSARQTRVQYTEAYLTKYVVRSNSYWDELEAEAKVMKYSNPNFRSVQGGLWFGDKNVTSSEGNITQSNAILENLKIDRLYMQSLIPSQPTFFRNFQFNEKIESDNWGALHQPDGGSINMENSYNYFHWYATMDGENRTEIKDQICDLTFSKDQKTNQNRFTFKKNGISETVTSTKVFVASGIFTGDVVKDVLKAGDVLNQEGHREEYVASYFEINGGNFEPDNFPTWIQFLPEKYTTGYGFPYHPWDNPFEKDGKKTIKLGTMAFKPLKPGYQPPSKVQVDNSDDRVKAAMDYVSKYMKNLHPAPLKNEICPIVFYDSRETICDYLNRVDKDIVVQTGGWIGKYYPLLAHSSYLLLFDPESLKKDPKKDVERKFLNRTSFPIRQTITTQLLQTPNVEKEHFDTVVVGAGCSGLYSTYRMLYDQTNENKSLNEKIGIFDMLDRIGGRLWSVRFKGSNTPMELGGMRYIVQSHKLLAHFISRLHIPTLDFQMSGNPLQNYQLKAYLRNDRYRQNQWTDLQSQGQKLVTAYRIDDELIGMNANQMITYSAYKIFTADYNDMARETLNVHRCDPHYFENHLKVSTKNGWTDYTFEFDLEDWNLLKPHLMFKTSFFGQLSSAKPLYKFGFQNVIENQFSHEAYNFIAEQNGYYSNTSNASYLDQTMTYLIDFGNVTYKTLAGGYDMFCYNLANQILNGDKSIRNKGGDIYLQKQLLDITRDETTKIYTLTMKDLTNNQVFSCTCKKLILGMPARSVELITQRTPLLQKPLTNYKKSQIKNLCKAIVPKDLLELISSTQRMPAIKIIMNFSENWWDIGKKYKANEQMRGVSVTDMPIRQTLYFGTNTDNFLLSSYNDMVTTEFWNTLQTHFEEFIPMATIEKCIKEKRKELYEKCLQEEKNSQGHMDRHKYFKMHQEKSYNSNMASVELVRQVVRQISLLHGTKVDFEIVKEAMYQNWGVDPFGAGYHNWFSGYDIEAVMKCMRRPWKEEEIFIVGEAFSNLTGWVEGALQTAEHMLRDEYNLKPALDEYIGY